MKDTFYTLIALYVCNVLPKLEVSTFFNNYDAISCILCKISWVKEWAKLQHKVLYQLVISLCFLLKFLKGSKIIKIYQREDVEKKI